ncbi:MAG: bifunctional nuclease family protein [Planctomycetota bacterium]
MSENGGVVEVELVRIVIRDTSDQQYIFLKEKQGERTFPIVIGFYEASAIDRRVRGVGTPRPMTHDLLGNAVEALGGRILKIVVNRLHENTFYARLHIQKDGEEIEIDCRPSDAIALAVQAEVSIFVAETVIDAVTGMPGP